MWKKNFKFIFFITILIGLRTQAFASSDTSYFNPYIKELEVKANENWDAPYRKQSCFVVVQFKIEKSGDINHCSIFKTSGDKFIDEIAIDAVEKLKHYKPLPSEFKGESIDVHLTFKYNLFKQGIMPHYNGRIEPIEYKKFYKSLSRENKRVYRQYLKCINESFKTTIPQEYFPKKKTFEADFVIQKNATIKDLIIVKSSNNLVYDKFITEAVQKTTLPNIPTELGLNELKLEYVINTPSVINLGHYYWYLPSPF